VWRKVGNIIASKVSSTTAIKLIMSENQKNKDPNLPIFFPTHKNPGRTILFSDLQAQRMKHVE